MPPAIILRDISPRPPCSNIPKFKSFYYSPFSTLPLTPKKDLSILTPLNIQHASENNLEPIDQGLHISIRGIPEFKAFRDNLDRPALQLRMLSSLEAKKEIPGVFGIDTECVHRTFGIRFGVGREPSFYPRIH